MTSTLLLMLSLTISCHGHQPAYQTPLGGEKICKDQICKFQLTFRDELSMTEKIVGQGRNPVTRSGETFLVAIEEGEEGFLQRKLGNYYNEPTYADLNNSRIQVSENVITADGVRRKLISINGVFPGPTLEVMEGVEVLM